jgi:ribosome assembly protein 1
VAPRNCSSSFGKWAFSESVILTAPHLIYSLRQRFESALDTPEEGVLDDSSESKDNDRLLRDFDDSIESGFQIATFQGPLCAEPMVGMAFLVESVDIGAEDDYDALRSRLAQATGSLISSVKDACRAGLLDWSPRIMLAMYTCDIQTSSASLSQPLRQAARVPR